MVAVVAVVAGRVILEKLPQTPDPVLAKKRGRTAADLLRGEKG